MSNLEKLNSYLGIADIDYLSARLLIMSGLPTVGLGKASEAMEKIFKLFFILYVKIENDVILDAKELKKYGHNLVELKNLYNKFVPKEHHLGEDWQEFLFTLTEAYNLRYPGHWNEIKLEFNLEHLDRAYVYMRNNVVQNFPVELRGRAREFGTFLGDIFTEEFIGRICEDGMLLPGDILRKNNSHFEILDVDREKGLTHACAQSFGSAPSG